MTQTACTLLNEVEKLIDDFDAYTHNFMFRSPIDFANLMLRFMVMQKEWMKLQIHEVGMLSKIRDVCKQENKVTERLKYQTLEIIKTKNGWIVKPDRHYAKEGRYYGPDEIFSFETPESLIEWLCNNITAEEENGDTATK
jgi:hypothetical protein